MPLTDEEIEDWIENFPENHFRPHGRPSYGEVARWAYDKACEDCAKKILETDVGHGQATDWAADFAGDCRALKHSKED